MNRVTAAKALAFSTLRALCRILPGRVYGRLQPRTIDPMYRVLRGDQSYNLRHAGSRFSLPATDSSLNRDLLLRGQYEPEAADAFISVLKPGMTVFDIGANIGYYTTLAAAAVGTSGRVYAFEPDPRNVQVLTQNAAQARGAPISVVPAAIGAQESTSLLFLNPKDSSINSLARANANVLGPGDTAQGVAVACVTLDGFIQHEQIQPPDVIKMDVQGAEMLALSGASGVLAHRPLKIFFEFWPYGLHQLGTEPVEVLDFLIGKGFTLHPLVPGWGVPLNSSRAAADFVRQWNENAKNKQTWHANFLASA